MNNSVIPAKNGNPVFFVIITRPLDTRVRGYDDLLTYFSVFKYSMIVSISASVRTPFCDGMMGGKPLTRSISG